MAAMAEGRTPFQPEINAITLLTSDMAASVAFYEVAGMEVVYGGDGTSGFTTLKLGSNFVNLSGEEGAPSGFWGRVIFHVESPDELWSGFIAAGYEPAFPPKDAAWGERYFHILDPDGHELSFARRLD